MFSTFAVLYMKLISSKLQVLAKSLFRAPPYSAPLLFIKIPFLIENVLFLLKSIAPPYSRAELFVKMAFSIKICKLFSRTYKAPPY